MKSNLYRFILSLEFVVSCVFYRTNPNSRCPSLCRRYHLFEVVQHSKWPLWLLSIFRCRWAGCQISRRSTDVNASEAKGKISDKTSIGPSDDESSHVVKIQHNLLWHLFKISPNFPKSLTSFHNNHLFILSSWHSLWMTTCYEVYYMHIYTYELEYIIHHTR